MKKFTSFVLNIFLIFTITPVFANNILGDAIYTDIVAYINHYPIPSYNFNGNTLIAAEDLANYGFDVKWNEYARSLTITRNKEQNEIVPCITFRPLESQLTQKSITITTTDVKVFTGNYQYPTFGGIYGKTLIRLNDLTCIDGISVTWVPEVKAVKVWVTDGLNMRTTPFNVPRIDNNFTYYEDCSGLDTWYHWQWFDTPSSLILTFAETVGENSNICTNCRGYIEITDVIDANGNSRLKNKHLYKQTTPTPVPYFYGFSNYVLSDFITIKNEDLYPNTATEHGGLIKVYYKCLGGSGITETIKVNCLPYE